MAMENISPGQEAVLKVEVTKELTTNRIYIFRQIPKFPPTVPG